MAALAVRGCGCAGSPWVRGAGSPWVWVAGSPWVRVGSLVQAGSAEVSRELSVLDTLWAPPAGPPCPQRAPCLAGEAPRAPSAYFTLSWRSYREPVPGLHSRMLQRGFLGPCGVGVFSHVWFE